MELTKNKATSLNEGQSYLINFQEHLICVISAPGKFDNFFQLWIWIVFWNGVNLICLVDPREPRLCIYLCVLHYQTSLHNLY